LDFARVLGLVADFLTGEEYDYAVIGAFGLHAYGLTRATSDLDFATQAEAQPKLLAFLVSEGYETINASPGYSNHVHPDPALGRVDFVYVAGETSRRLFEGCKRIALAGRMVPVPRPEHLAAMKVQAMKNDPERTLQEMADVRFLLGLPGVDEAEIRGYFEKSGLKERYEDIQRLP
jgi:hypothetical protein